MRFYLFQVLRDLNYLQIIKISFLISILFASVLSFIFIAYFPNHEIATWKLKNRKLILEIRYSENRLASIEKKMAVLKTENEKLKFKLVEFANDAESQESLTKKKNNTPFSLILE